MKAVIGFILVAAMLFFSPDFLDASENLKSEKKLRRIEYLNGKNGFAYAGNSKADLPIWSQAGQVYMVNCADSLATKLADKAEVITRFDSPDSDWKNFWQAMRPHQWLKNCLVFLPLILGQLPDAAYASHLDAEPFDAGKKIANSFVRIA